MLFPTNEVGATEFMENSNLENFEFDDHLRFLTDYHGRTDYKRIFSVGGCSAMTYFGTSSRIPGDYWNVAYH